MRGFMLRRWLGFCILAMASSGAQAADVLFTIYDGPTSEFYGREHVAGSYVSGVLHGLPENGTAAPTSVSFTHVDPALGYAGGVLNPLHWGGFGFTLLNGSITAADFSFNFNDSDGDGFQLRLNASGSPTGANWLFWNGGDNPIVGTGNTLGFAGAIYGQAGPVPEPATWAMMLLGFGAVGFTMRRRRAAEVAATA